MRQYLLVCILLFTFGACYGQAPFDISVKWKQQTDSIELTIVDVFNKVEDSSVLFTYTIDQWGNVLDSAMAMLVKNVAKVHYRFQPMYKEQLYVHVQLRLNGQPIYPTNYKLVSEIDTLISQLMPMVVNPIQMPVSFFTESGKLLNGFSQRVQILPNFDGKGFTGRIKLYDVIGNQLSDFVFKEQRILYLTMPDNGLIKCVLNDTLTSWLHGSRKGYALLNTPKGDSVEIVVYRGLDEPSQSLSLVLETNGKKQLLLNLSTDPEIFIYKTSLAKQFLNDQPYALRLQNAANQILAQRYFMPINKVGNYFPLVKIDNIQKILADPAFTTVFKFRSKVKKPPITYHVVKEGGELVDLGNVAWINDTLFTINPLQLYGNGNIQFNIEKRELYGNDFSVSLLYPADYEDIKYFFRLYKENKIVFTKQVSYEENEPNNQSKFLLPNVTVSTKTKTRIEELENKYVSSNLFKQMFEKKINVLDDDQARNGLNIFDYLAMRDMRLRVTFKKIAFPIPRVVKTIIADFYVDEVFTDVAVVSEILVSEIAYIKVFNTGIRGGSFNRAIAIYTKKGNENESSTIIKYRLPLIGIQQVN